MNSDHSSRRRFLAGLATAGATAVGGCSGLPFTGDEEGPDSPASIPSDAVGEIERPPSPFPVAVPEALADAHETRARELLDEVPADPLLPNEAVAAEIGADRESARRRLDADPPDGWPHETLTAWRRRRENAASVRGAHRAATGTDDGSALAERRRAVRNDRGALASALEYRAGDPVEAVLACEPVESLLAECERHVRPRVTYPADPVAEPFRAGEAVAHVERAASAMTDAAALHELFLDGRESPAARWASLVAGAEVLQESVRRTRDVVRRRIDDGGSPVDEDLSGTVAQELFVLSERRVESSVEEVDRALDAGEYATAVAEAGIALAAIEALRASTEAIRDGEYGERPTASSVRSVADRARTAVRDATADGDPLATRLVDPAVETFEYVADRAEEGYSSPRRTQAELAYVALYAGAVSAAAEFVRDRLE